MGRVEEALRKAAERSAVEETEAGQTAGRVDLEFPEEEGSEAERSVESTPLAAADTARDVDEYRVPAAEAPATGSDRSTKLIGDERMLATSREQYRRLAATLHHMQAVNGLKVVLIASAVAGEGKTLTAANLALTFSDSYERDVLLIDADLRRPSLARTFGISAIPGLSDGLVRDYVGALPLQQVSDRLTVLPAGRATPDPMAGLTSERMKQLIAEARAAFDWVIIDTPPIGLMTDANLLSAIADGVVLVIKANATPLALVRRAVTALGTDKLLGTVLNRATATPHAYKYYDYYHYAPTTPEPTARE